MFLSQVPFSAIDNNEQKKPCTFARKCRKLSTGVVLSADMLYQGEWNEKMWAVLEEISSLSR